MIRHISSVTCFVDDQDRAKRFYVEVLGMTERLDTAMGPARWVEVTPPGAQTGVALLRPFPGTSPGSTAGVVLVSADLDGDVDHLREHGVEVSDPQDLPWGRQATFTDPDGNGFVLMAGDA